MKNIFYEKLSTEARGFIKRIKATNLVVENNHLIVELENFTQKINSFLKNNNIQKLDSLKILDFKIISLLETFIKDEEILNLHPKIHHIAKDLYEAINEIKNELEIKNDLRRYANSGIIELSEPLINQLINREFLFIRKDLEKLNDIEIKTIEIKEKFQSFNEEIEKISSNAELSISNAEAKLLSEQINLNNELRKSVEAKVDSIFSQKIQSIEVTYESIKKLSSEIAGKIISNDFSKSSRREGLYAEIFRILGFLSLIMAAFIIYKNFEFTSLSGKLNIENIEIVNFIRSTTITIFLLSISIIFLKESNKHRQQQYFYESQSLKLLSVTPLISDISKESQEEVKKDVAKSLFMAEQKININDDTSSAFLGMTKIIEKIIEKQK